MSLDADAIVDRRRLRRKLTFWRVCAIVIVVLVVIGAGIALVPGSRPIDAANRCHRPHQDLRDHPR